MTIKKILIILLLALVSRGYSQEKGIGVGIMLGEPTGLSAKYWLDESSAVSGGIAYSFLSVGSRLSIHADVINHLWNVLPVKEKIPFYYGFGFRLRTGESEGGSFGVRGVAGFVWQRKDYPVDIFVEAVPVFKLLPETNLDFDASVGARYYFLR